MPSLRIDDGDHLTGNELNAMIIGINENGVYNGAHPSANSPPNASIYVSPYNIFISGTEYSSASQTNVAVPTGSYIADRKDILIYDKSETALAVVTGSEGDPAISPAFDPTEDVLIAELSIPSDSNNLPDANIEDQRVFTSSVNRVSKAGDTMTGNLEIDKTNPVLKLNATTGTGKVIFSSNDIEKMGLEIASDGNYMYIWDKIAGASCIGFNRTTGDINPVGNVDGVDISTHAASETSHQIRDYHLIGTDLTQGSVTNTTTETEIGYVGITANTVKTGIIIIATCHGLVFDSKTINVYLKFDDVTKISGVSQMGASYTGSFANYDYITLCWYQPITDSYFHGVSVTGLCSVASTDNAAYCDSILVFGV